MRNEEVGRLEQLVERMREAADNGDRDTQDQLFREVFQAVPVQARIRAVLEYSVKEDPLFNGVSGTFGFVTGLTAAHLHPEWAQAMFQELHPTESQREEAAVAYKDLVAKLPVSVEQEAQT